MVKHLNLQDNSEMAERMRDGNQFYLPPEIWQRVSFPTHPPEFAMDRWPTSVLNLALRDP
jgi:hypothetical protein